MTLFDDAKTYRKEQHDREEFKATRRQKAVNAGAEYQRHHEISPNVRIPSLENEIRRVEREAREWRQAHTVECAGNDIRWTPGKRDTWLNMLASIHTMRLTLCELDGRPKPMLPKELMPSKKPSRVPEYMEKKKVSREEAARRLEELRNSL